MTDVEPIARALLYEGYVLYPYRADALKNRHRWTPGGLVPRAYSAAHGGSEPWFLRAECLVHGNGAAVLSVRVRFLHLLERTDRDSSWQEATESEVAVTDAYLNELAGNPGRVSFAVPASRTVAGEVARTRHAIEGAVEVSAAPVGDHLFRVAVRVSNDTPLDAPVSMSRDAAVLRSLASAHVALGVRGGAFVSLTDPPEGLKPFAEGCRNVGAWPVLVGDPGRRDAVLAAPVILSDYPRVAPESPGDFFDGTEIDEMLALRVLTLTDDEKRRMGELDARTRALLDRVEGLSDARLAGLHGTIRDARPVPRPGDRVRLRPRGRADAFDLLLAGRAATVVAVEHDFEGTTYVTATVDDDPGRDLGASGQPGHRFFFRCDEVEPLAEGGLP